MKVYQLEARIAGEWVPVDALKYGCSNGQFRELLAKVNLTPGQRLRRVSARRGNLWLDPKTKEIIPWPS